MSDEQGSEKEGIDEATLDRLLARAPEPAVPADLAARIVRTVTTLPQQDAAPLSLPVVAAPRKSSGRRRAAWVGGIVGTALAAGLATLLVVPEETRQQAVAPTPPTSPLRQETARTADTPAPALPREDQPRMARTEPAHPAPSPTPHASSPAPSEAASPTKLQPPEQLAIEEDEPSTVTGDPDEMGYDTQMAEGSGNRSSAKSSPAEGYGYAPGDTRSPDFSAPPAPRSSRGGRRF